MIRWPSGITQVLYDLALDTTHEVKETGLLRVGTVELGQSSHLVAAAPPGAPTVRLGSATLATTWVPSLQSMLHLAPPIQWLRNANIPFCGPLTLPVDVPNNPALVGSQYHVQALIGGSSGVLSSPVDVSLL